jgi:hypothetical protein
VEEEDEDEEEDKDEDDCKQSRTIAQGEMVNTSADDADTMVDNEPTLRPEQCQEMREHTTWPQPLPYALQPQIPEPSSRPRTPETHTLSQLEFLEHVMPLKYLPAAPTRRHAEAAENTLDVDVDLQLIGELADCDWIPDVPLLDVPLLDVPLRDVPLPDIPLPGVPLPDVPLLNIALPNVALPNVALPNVPLPDVPLRDVPLPDVPLPEVRPNGSVGEE